MEEAKVAMMMPNANVWTQTFMKRHEQVVVGSGEFTYTSELK